MSNRKTVICKHYIISGDIQKNQKGEPIYYPRKADIRLETFGADRLKWQKVKK